MGPQHCATTNQPSEENTMDRQSPRVCSFLPLMIISSFLSSIAIRNKMKIIKMVTPHGTAPPHICHSLLRIYYSPKSTTTSINNTVGKAVRCIILILGRAPAGFWSTPITDQKILIRPSARLIRRQTTKKHTQKCLVYKWCATELPQHAIHDSMASCRLKRTHRSIDHAGTTALHTKTVRSGFQREIKLHVNDYVYNWLLLLLLYRSSGLVTAHFYHIDDNYWICKRNWTDIIKPTINYRWSISSDFLFQWVSELVSVVHSGTLGEQLTVSGGMQKHTRISAVRQTYRNCNPMWHVCGFACAMRFVATRSATVRVQLRGGQFNKKKCEQSILCHVEWMASE